MESITASRRTTPACISKRTAFLSAALLLASFGFLSGCGGVTSSASQDPNPPSAPAPEPAPTPTPQSCPTVKVAMAAGPTSGVAVFPAPAEMPAPTPGSTSAGSVCVSTPADGATVASPARIYAQTTLPDIDHMRIYIDGTAEYFTFFNTADALLWMTPGAHTLLVLATDKSGNEASTSFHLNITQPQTPETITNVQSIPNWEPCSAKFPPGHPRAGQICAAGLGDAASTMTENQSSPSLSGASAHFTMGGTAPYSNELYTKFLGGGSQPTHFVYDMYFMIDHPEFAQALEFDVNQAFNNVRWVFGTECNFKDSGRWDVWDGVKGWQPTTVPCKPFPANQWVHLVWTFERVGQQVHYISLAIDDQVYPLDLYYSNAPNWTMESIDVAFQMDGDYRQDPYNIWIDKVSFTAW